MPDQTATATVTTTVPPQSKLNIPDETRAQFPELIAMVEKSPSMNDEERQYWVDVLPIMTEDQIGNLRDILGNEKHQIDTANQTYAKGVGEATTKVKIAFDEAAYKAKKDALKQAEKAHETEEKTEEEAALKEIEGIQI